MPPASRKILALALPVFISLALIYVPAFYRLFAWLPLIGPDASVFLFATLASALSAYLMLRVPQGETV